MIISFVIDQMDVSKVLSKLAVQFLDNWVELQDESEFQELVLVCLRSIYARYQSIQVNKSETT
jgi:hypothetical protein